MSKARQQTLVEQLQLEPHPEGGFYKRVYESAITQYLPMQVCDADGAASESIKPRLLTTAIQYLLPANQYSAWHRIQSDELWFVSEISGGELVVYEIADGQLLETRLSASQPFHVVKAGRWFASVMRDAGDDDFVLCHCVVSPGFDFDDFEMASVADIKASLTGNDVTDALMLLR